MAYYSWVYPFHTYYSHNSIGCTKISPKYGSLDTGAAINGVTQWEIVELSASQNYKASVGFQWRRLLSESVICSACQFIYLFSLEADIMSFQYVQKLAYFFICSLCGLSKPKCSCFCYRADNTSRMSHHVSTSYQSVVRSYFGGAHYFGHS